MTDRRQQAVHALHVAGVNLIDMTPLERTATIQHEVDNMTTSTHSIITNRDGTYSVALLHADGSVATTWGTFPTYVDACHSAQSDSRERHNHAVVWGGTIREVDAMTRQELLSKSGQPLTEDMIMQAEEVKDTRDNGYVGTGISEIAPGGFFKTQRTTAKGTATEVTVDCEHCTHIGVVVRWYDDGSRRVRFEQFHQISRKEAEAQIKDAIAVAAEDAAVQRAEQAAGA